MKFKNGLGAERHVKEPLHTFEGFRLSSTIGNLLICVTILFRTYAKLSKLKAQCKATQNQIKVSKENLFI